jgi:diadenosine tetraphosphate (Ap4A) HIT family hydrolase
VASIDGLGAEDAALWAHLLLLAQRMARAQGIDIEADGYQLATSAGRHLNRLYPHLHIHLLSGTPLTL